jgi:hypothetical protein
MQSINFAQHLNTAIIFVKTIDIISVKSLEGTFYITSNNFSRTEYIEYLK